MVAECVAIKSGLTEIVQTVKILCRELVVSQLIVAKLIVGERVMTCVRDTMASNPSSITGHCVIVTEIMGSELMTAAAHGVTSRKAVSAQCMATPPMTNVGQATMGSKRMNPTASAMPAATPTAKPGKPTASAKPVPTPAAKSTPTPTPTATTATLSGERRDVRHHAERANRNARGQNTYCFLPHGTFPTRSSKALRCLQRSRADLTDLTVVAPASFEMAKSKYH
jgi:hypothetical protein